MAYSFVTIIAPDNKIGINGEVVDIHEIESITVDQNGVIVRFMKEQPKPVSRKDAEFGGLLEES